jgi:acetylornithine deacetylase/succinyl-diaminopimelate desuccinylase-like protein
LSHPRVTVTIEGSEEGEIEDLIYYIKNYKQDLGKPDVIICLDCSAYTEETLTVTNSLRGCLNFDLTATVGTNDCHSGMGGGVIPNAFQILTNLIGRVQDLKTQNLHPDFQVEIPDFSHE